MVRRCDRACCCVSFFYFILFYFSTRGDGCTVFVEIWLAGVGELCACVQENLEIGITAVGRAVCDLAKLGRELGVVKVGLGDQTHTLDVTVVTDSSSKVPDVAPAGVDAVSEVISVISETAVHGWGRGGSICPGGGGGCPGGGHCRDTRSGVWSCEGGSEERKSHGRVNDRVGKHCGWSSGGEKSSLIFYCKKMVLDTVRLMMLLFLILEGGGANYYLSISVPQGGRE